MTTIKPLYHFTCSHAVPRIQDAGLLLSPLAVHGADDRRFLTDLVWLTTLDTGLYVQLGMLADPIHRTEYRVKAQWDTSDVEPWTHYRRRLLKADRDHPARDWITKIEAVDGALPAMWFVTDRPVPIDIIDRPRSFDTAGGLS